MGHARKPAARKAAARPVSLLGAVVKLAWRLFLILAALVVLYLALPYLIVLGGFLVVMFGLGGISKAAFATKRDD